MAAAACEQKRNFAMAEERSQGELFRHLFAWSRMKQEANSSHGCYENRIKYYGSGRGDLEVSTRISHIGSIKLQLPRLVFDDQILHEASDLVSVHRCLFDYQPEFMNASEMMLCV